MRSVKSTGYKYSYIKAYHRMSSSPFANVAGYGEWRISIKWISLVCKQYEHSCDEPLTCRVSAVLNIDTLLPK